MPRRMACVFVTVVNGSLGFEDRRDWPSEVGLSFVFLAPEPHPADTVQESYLDNSGHRILQSGRSPFIPAGNR